MRYRTLDGVCARAAKPCSRPGALHPPPPPHHHPPAARAPGGRHCSEPNLMGLPAGEGVRRGTLAPPGMKLIVADYSNIEMRVIADTTGDEKLREAFSAIPTATRIATPPGGGGSPRPRCSRRRNKIQARELRPVVRHGSGQPHLVRAQELQARVDPGRNWSSCAASSRLQGHPGVARKELGGDARAAPHVCTNCATTRGSNAGLSFPIQVPRPTACKGGHRARSPQLARLGARIVLVVHDELVVEVPEEHSEEGAPLHVMV